MAGKTHTVVLGGRTQVCVECDSCRIQYVAWIGGGMILGRCPSCRAFGFHLVAGADHRHPA